MTHGDGTSLEWNGAPVTNKMLNFLFILLFIAHCIALHIVYYTSNTGIGEPDGEAEVQALAMNLF